MTTKRFLYTFETHFNTLEFNPEYPANPKTRGERIRKARMDMGLQIKELASLLNACPQSVIQWELENIGPVGRNVKALERVLDLMIG